MRHGQNPPSPSSEAGPPSLRLQPPRGPQGPKAQVQVSLWLSSPTQPPSQPVQGPRQPQLAGPACSSLGFSCTTAWQLRTGNLLTVLLVTSVFESAAPWSRRCCGEKLPGQGGAHPPAARSEVTAAFTEHAALSTQPPTPHRGLLKCPSCPSGSG